VPLECGGDGRFAAGDAARQADPVYHWSVHERPPRGDQ
jgi:hypothetical protein